MDEILLYLSLKYNGEGMAIYDSLQKKEELKVYDIKKAVNEVDADGITLISADYPKNLKAIYKPPFGVFVYGKSKLLHTNIVSVYGKVEPDNIHGINILKQYATTLGNEPNNKTMLALYGAFEKDNIFVVDELKPFGNHTLVSNENFMLNNAVVSELWKRDENADYTNQGKARLHLGLSLQCLIISDLPAKQLKEIATYCEKEDIKIGVLSECYNDKIKNAFKFCKVNIIKEQIDIKNHYEPLN